jgi:signal transduction histidine kinase
MRTLAVLLACVAALSSRHAAAADVAPIIIAETDFVMADSAAPPPADADWKPQQLPDQWRQSRSGLSGDGWYRATVTLAAPPTGIWAVYLPRLCMNAAVFVNGEFVGDGGRFAEPVARNWNRPLLLRIPATLLRAGPNTLHIRLRSFPMAQGSLAPVEIAPEQLLLPVYEREFFARITVNQALTLIIAMVGVLMLSMWWRRRRDSMYGYFGASALVWALNSSNLHIQYAPLSTRYWEILINATFEIFAPLVLISLLRFVGKEHRRLERLLWGIAVIAPASMLLTPDRFLVDVFSAWHLVTLAGAFLTLLVLVPVVLRRRDTEGRLLIAALLINLGLAVHDWLVHAKALPPVLGASTRVHLLHYGAPVFFLIVGWIMTSRFVGALNQLERMNVELEDRVAAKTVELETNFQHLQTLRSEQAVLEERERIYGDLHDDIGAKLLQLVYRAGTPVDAELARSALQDLRDVVSQPRGSPLAIDDLLADWRAEADQRITAAGLKLNWQQGETLAAGFLQPHAIHIGRVLREALSNVIRHAGASSVSVAVHCDAQHFRLGVTDDGRGYDPLHASHGSGISNIRQRARRIGGTVEWRAAPGGGCCMELLIPLPRGA